MVGRAGYAFWEHRIIERDNEFEREAPALNRRFTRG
jgi:hypothetical protein